MVRHAGHRDPRRLGRGFTLLELVLVVSIVGVVAAIAAPRYGNAIQNYRANAAALRIQADLEYARARAKTTSTSRIFTVSPATEKYAITGEISLDGAGAYVVDLAEAPYRSVIVSADLGGDGQVVFDGFGLPDSDGVIIVRAGSLSKAITIDLVTGVAKVEDVTAALVAELTAKGLTVVLGQ